MDNNVCKKCKKPLPQGYKHKKCESCINAQVEMVKKGLVTAGSVVASVAIAVVTKGKINLKK